MPAPTTWNAPSSGGSLSRTSAYTLVSYVNDYWIAVSNRSTTTYDIRVATDPTGAWSTADTPSLSAGYTCVSISRVVYTGSYYVCAIAVNSGSTYELHSIYATDPYGTWSQAVIATGDYATNGIAYLDGNIVVGGRYATTNDEGFIAYCSTPNGTWTIRTGSDIGISGYLGSNTRVTSLYSDGTHLVHAWSDNGTTTAYPPRYATDPAGTWTASGTNLREWAGSPTLRHVPSRGQWVMSAYLGTSTADTQYVLASTSDATGTWSTRYPSAIEPGVGAVTAMDAGNRYWVIGARVNTNSTHRMWYVDGDFATGSYVQITDSGMPASSGSYSTYISDVRYGGGYFVAANIYQGRLRVSYVGLSSGDPTLLRQRQSPKRTPSRVRGPDLRQRQTPFIT